MAKRLAAEDLRKWALVGAEQWLAATAVEAAAIHRVFPELRGRVRAVAAVVARTGRKVAGRKRRRRMSAAGRAKLRTALKRRWAAAKKAGKTRLG